MRALLLSVVLCATSVQAQPSPAQAWNQALEWRTSSPVPVPAGGITIPLDSAELRLDTGVLRVLEAVGGDAPSGFVFEGAGHFTMQVPDAVELEQLRRFTREKSLERIDTSVKRVVFRSSQVIEGLPAAAAPFTPDKLARDRHEVWLTETFEDVDAKIIAARLGGEPIPVVRIDLDTEKHAWLTYIVDPWSIEEVRLENVVANKGSEDWISLDHSSHRAPNGRPGTAIRERFDQEHLDVDVDLTKSGRFGNVGYADVRSSRAKFTGTTRIKPRESGLNSIALWISSSAEVKEVRGSDGSKLPFVRDQLGKRARKLENDTWVPAFFVFLPEPTEAGRPIELTLQWEMDLPAYGGGMVWYPTVAENHLDPLTARMRFSTIDRQDVRAVGARSESGTGGSKVVEYAVTVPTKMLGFVVGERFVEQEIPAANGVPRVAAWGPRHGFGANAEIRNVAVDVHNSIHFFSWLLDEPLEQTEMIAAGIASGHGQAFDGYLQMADYTFGHDSPGATELFRAHEVAHQWFGHRVGWKTPRDQWLSESLAEYAAMLFVQNRVQGGAAFFDEILQTYHHLIFGSLKGAGSKFSRPWLIEMNDRWRERVGPIGHGRRASTVEVPGGYQLQAYHKGPLVIHSLRVMLNYKHPQDEMFLRILRAYVNEHRNGTPATTASFREIVNRETGVSWDWFFDQWIDRAALPTYRWSWQQVPDGDGWKVTVKARQTEVPDTFVMPVPVQFELPDKKTAFGVITVTGAGTVEKEFRLPVKARGVEFNAGHGVIAEVRKE